MRLGEPDESGRHRPEPVPGSEFVIPVDTVVKAIGQRPRDEFLELIESVDEEGRTSNPKVFAAGDAINGGASVVQAVREAKLAVEALDGRLQCDEREPAHAKGRGARGNREVPPCKAPWLYHGATGDQ